ITELFGDSSDINIHSFHFPLNENENKDALLVYINAFIDDHAVNRYILDPLKTYADRKLTSKLPIADIKNRLNISEITEETDLNRSIDIILHHEALLIIDGFSTGLLMNVSSIEKRSLEEPYTESAVKGPH